MDRFAHINKSIVELRSTIAEMERELKLKEAERRRMQDSCKHEWIERHDVERKAGYKTEGDPPGTMGVDWRPPVYVSPKTIDHGWVRTCVICGAEERTKKVEEKVAYKPVWG